MGVLRSRVIGAGHYLPQKIVNNNDLAKTVDTSDEWIQERTGIKQRHVAAEGEFTSHLAIKAAQNALKNANINADEIDVLVLATATPDNTFPATSTRVQHAIGMTKGAAFDVSAVCSGFIYALMMADNMIKAGRAKKALVIGAETFSRILDWNDRNTCVLFGDGAGAIVLSAEEGKGSKDDFGVIDVKIHSDGSQYDTLLCTGGASTTQTSGFVYMNGREVFRHAVTNLAEVAEEIMKENNISSEELDWLLPHQANLRIIDGTAKKLSLNPEKVVITVDKHANTSAASIPMAFSEAIADGRIKKGQLVLMDAMGGGFTWGAALVRV